MKQETKTAILAIVDEIAHAREMATRAPNVTMAEQWRKREFEHKMDLLAILEQLRD